MFAWPATRVAQRVQLGAGRVAQDQHEVAGLVGRQRKQAAACGDADAAGVSRTDFRRLRHVLVRAVALLRQDRTNFRCTHSSVSPSAATGFELLVHGQPVRLPRAAALDEREVAIGLHADEKRRIRHDGAVLRGDVAAAFRLERAPSTFRRYARPTKRFRSRLNSAVPAVVGVSAAQRFLIRLVQRFADLKAVVRVASRIAAAPASGSSRLPRAGRPPARRTGARP